VLSAALHARLLELKRRHDSLSEELAAEARSEPPPASRPHSTPAWQSSPSLERVVLINKELSQLSPVVDCFAQLRALEQASLSLSPSFSLLTLRAQEVAGLDVVLAECKDEEELRALAAEERAAASLRAADASASLALLLVPADEADERDCILEVRAGAGGDEAALFAADLLRMYERFSDLRGFSFELLTFNAAGGAGGADGCKEASASICGAGAFGALRLESGVHRVQRVPATETQGRVHTSTASVAVLPQASEVDVELRDGDVRVDTYRSSGAGGQHVNTTCSAVRVTHIPTGISVAIQDERSQHKNRAKAMKVLRARLYELARARVDAARAAERKGQIGSGDRSERIRTYNFGQGRVKDHRCGLAVGDAAAVLSGERLDEFVDALRAAETAERLAVLEGVPVKQRARGGDDD